MKKLLRYLKNYIVESIFGPLFKLTEAIFELIVPLVMADIIDVGIAQGDTNYILRKGGVLILFGLLGLACSLTAQFFAAKASVGFGTELRHDMFNYIMNLSFTELDNAGTATLINRLTVDVNQVQSGVNLALRLFLRSPFIVLGAVIMAFTIDVRLALIFVVATPLIAVAVCAIMMKTIPMFRQIQSKFDRILMLSRGNLSGIRVVRAFARQEDERKQFDATTDELCRMSLQTGRISALINPLSYALLNGAVILVIWRGGISVDTGRITQGEVIALVNYLTQILLALIAMVNLINTFTKTIASAGRVVEVFDPEEYRKSLNTAGKASVDAEECRNGISSRREREIPDDIIISADNVSFTYPGSDEPALSGINFDIKKGETIGIIGGTGAGKTTLINLMAGFYRADGGVLRIDGQPADRMSGEDFRKVFSMVPQKKNLFRGTIRDNLLFGREASDESLQRALEIAQAAEFVNKPGVGLDYLLEQGAMNLSGGQRQRLTIARAFVCPGKVLVLDDSASALDFATDAALRKSIAENSGDMTVIVVSQRIGSIMNADRILVLDDGAQAGFGTHAQLLEGCEVYREIYESQTL